MEDYNYPESRRPSRRTGAIILNVLTVLVLIATLCISSVFAVIFMNPRSGLNLFPPPTLPVRSELPTVTPTPLSVLPPTWTPLPSPTATITSTPRPTQTDFPTETPFLLFTESPTPEETASADGMPFEVAAGSPVAVQSTAIRPDTGCDWMGVAGQVFDMSGAPVATGVVIQLSGVVGGNFIDKTSLSGVAPAYGPSGYEIYLSDTPAASNRTLWIQLLDQAGLPMSEKVFFSTYAECERNLILINFKQVR